MSILNSGLFVYCLLDLLFDPIFCAFASLRYFFGSLADGLFATFGAPFDSLWSFFSLISLIWRLKSNLGFDYTDRLASSFACIAESLLLKFFINYFSFISSIAGCLAALLMIGTRFSPTTLILRLLLFRAAPPSSPAILLIARSCCCCWGRSML